MPDKNTLAVDMCNGTVGDMKELDVAESFKSKLCYSVQVKLQR